MMKSLMDQNGFRNTLPGLNNICFEDQDLFQDLSPCCTTNGFISTVEGLPVNNPAETAASISECLLHFHFYHPSGNKKTEDLDNIKSLLLQTQKPDQSSGGIF